MKLIFEELDYRKTPLGEISLRRRSEPMLGNVVIYEVKLDDEFLMSSLFTVSEIQLARLGLGALEGEDRSLDVVVGGLGLGYTAVAVLDDPKVRSLRIIEVLEPVIEWHRQGLVPLGQALTSDPRCTLARADFFDLAVNQNGFDPAAPDKPVHAVLLDIDHSPRQWLKDSNSTFYTEQGLNRLMKKILPGGIFGLWSNDPPDTEFGALLKSVFQDAESHIVMFPNPYTNGESSNTIYLARKSGK